MFPDETNASDETAAPKKRPAKKRAATVETSAEAPVETAAKPAAKKRAPAKKASPGATPVDPVLIAEPAPAPERSAAPTPSPAPILKSEPSIARETAQERTQGGEAHQMTPAPSEPGQTKIQESRIKNPPAPPAPPSSNISPGPSLFDELSGDEPTRPALAPKPVVKPAAPVPTAPPARIEEHDEVPRPKAGQIMSFDPDEDDSPTPSPASVPTSAPTPDSAAQIKNQESRISNPQSQRPPLSAKDRLLFLKQKKFGNAARPFVQPNPVQSQQPAGHQQAPSPAQVPPAAPTGSPVPAFSPAASPGSAQTEPSLAKDVATSGPQGSEAPQVSPAPSEPAQIKNQESRISNPASPVSPASPPPRPPQQGQPHGQRPPHPQQQNQQPRPPQPPQPPRPPRPEPPKGKPARHRHSDKEPLDNNTFWPGDLHNDPIFANAASADAAAAALIEADKQPVLLNEWFKKPFKQLLSDAQALGITFETAPTKSFLNAAVIRHFAEKRVPTHVEGILFLSEEGDGAIVYTEDSYRLKPHSTYLSHHFVARYGLRKGQILRAQVHPRRETESCPFAVALVSVMGRDPKEAISFEQFEELIPYYPLQRIMLENDPKVSWDNNAMRVFDLLTPIGLGQRSLIVAPPRTGKTVILQCIANTVAVNSPEAHLIVLLVDERPEEVTDFSRQVKNGEVISSTFDETAESHVHAAEMVIEKARRMVEVGRHVIILLDSITRLGRAYNTLAPNSGKILSGGVEASALQRPKRFFGSARNIEGGGSLTIIGTALVETGSRMDEVIFEEFKGTGNMELHLDRALSDKRIFPAINLEKSGTRKEELLYHPMELEKVIALRRAMKGVPATDAMEMLITRIKKSKTNAEFLVGLNR